MPQQGYKPPDPNDPYGLGFELRPAEPMNALDRGVDWWENQWINKPVTTAPSDIARYIISNQPNYDMAQQRMNDFIPGLGTADAAVGGFFKGAAQGLGDLVTGMATPLNLATMGSAALENVVTKYGIEGAAKVLGLTTKALSSLFVGSGGAKTYQGISEDDPMKAGQGIVEMAGGLPGVIPSRMLHSNVPGFIPPKSAGEYVPHDIPFDASYMRDQIGPHQAPSMGSQPQPHPGGLAMSDAPAFQGPEVGPYGTPNPNQRQLPLGMDFPVRPEPRQGQLLDLPANTDPYGMINQVEGMWPPLEPIDSRASQPGFDFGPPDMGQLSMFDRPIPGLDQSPFIAPTRPPMSARPEPPIQQAPPGLAEHVPPSVPPNLNVTTDWGEVVGHVDPQTGKVIPLEKPVPQVPDENMVPVGNDPRFNIGVNEPPVDDFTRPPTAPPVQGTPTPFDVPQPGSNVPLNPAVAGGAGPEIRIRPSDKAGMRWAEANGFVRDPEPQFDGKVRYVRPITPEPPQSLDPNMNGGEGDPMQAGSFVQPAQEGPSLVPTQSSRIPVSEPSISEESVLNRPEGGWGNFGKSRATILAEAAGEGARRDTPNLEGVTYKQGNGVIVAIVSKPTEAVNNGLRSAGYMPYPGNQLSREGLPMMVKGDASKLPPMIGKGSPRTPPIAAPEDIKLPTGENLSEVIRQKIIGEKRNYEMTGEPWYWDFANNKWTPKAWEVIPNNDLPYNQTIPWMKEIERRMQAKGTSTPPKSIAPSAEPTITPNAMRPGRESVQDIRTISNSLADKPGYLENMTKGGYRVIERDERYTKFSKTDPTTGEPWADSSGGESPEVPFEPAATPEPELTDTTASRWSDAVKQLDEAGAPDEAYRSIMSPEKEMSLGAGETWRDKVRGAIDFFESKVPERYKGEKGQSGSVPVGHMAGTAMDIGQRFKESTGIGMGEQPRARPKNAPPSIASEVMGAAKNIITPFDASMLLRQGLPSIFTRQFIPAAKAMIRAGRSIEVFDHIDAEIKKLPIMQEQWDPATGKTEPSRAAEAGLKQFTIPSRPGPKAEGIVSRYLETGGNIPGFSDIYSATFGRGFRISNRMAVTFLNHLSANRMQFLFDNAKAMSDVAVAKGRAPMEGVLGNIGFHRDYTRAEGLNVNPYHNLERAKEIADYVNTATGHAPLRIHVLPHRAWELNLESSAKALNMAFFSPSQMASRARMMNPNTYIMASPFVRKQYLKSLVSTAAAWYGFVQMAKLAGGEDVEVSDDITSADFGKIRIGNTRIDPAGGFQQYLVAYGRLFHGGSTSSSTGTFHRFGSGYQAQTQEDMFERFFVNKLNPLTKFGWDLLNASEYNQFHVGDRVAQQFVPLVWQDAVELYREDPKLLPWMIPIMMGMGSQTYSKGESVSKLWPEEYDWNTTGGGLRDLIPGMASSYELAGLPEPE